MWSATFDHVNHEWLRKFLRHRVNDGGLLRLIDKWLKAGVMENGVVTLSEDGHMLENGHEELPIDLADGGTHRFKFVNELAEKGQKF